MTDTERLRALLKAATIKGPLILREQSGVHNQRIESADICQMDRPDMTVASLHIVVWKPGRRDARPNAKLIAEAVNALPGLLAEVERLRAALRKISTWRTYEEGALPVTPSELREIAREALNAKG